MYTLHVGNKNYSSWSLRPWLLLREMDIPFEEKLTPFVEGGSYALFRSFSPTGSVPVLIDDGLVVWESLAIVEYLAERHVGIWPADPVARAFARCAAAEMHAGFAALRNDCTMNCGLRVRLHGVSAALQRDLDRLGEIWNEGLAGFGGPFLAGDRFSAADAFFAPVALRMQTYGLRLDPVSMTYAERLLRLEGMRDWYAAALAEPFREVLHEGELASFGDVLEDLRCPPA